MASAVGHEDHLVNFEALRMAQQSLGGFGKYAFVPGGDPSGGGGGGAPPPGGGGGAPPGGGGMPPGMDPSMMGGGPPPGPPPGGGGGGGGEGQMMQMLLQKMTAIESGMGGAGGAGGNKALQPKIDEKVVLTQILKILARIADALKITIPASEMVVNQADLGQLAQATTNGTPMPGMDPSAGGGGGGGGAGAIPPIDPMQGMQPAGPPPGGGGEKMGSYKTNGTAFDSTGLTAMGGRAAAIANAWKNRGK